MAQNGFEIKKPYTKEEWESYHTIQAKEIFAPVHIDYDRDHPTLYDQHHHHYIFLKEGEIIGTLHLETLNAAACAIRTIAIKSSCQGVGYGRTLLSFAEALIRQKGFKMIHLHADPKLRRFYEANGFTEMAFPVNETTIQHGAVDYGKIL